MYPVELELAANGHGSFFIMIENRRAAEMVVALHETVITVFHTEVIDELKGKGVASKLVEAMVQ